MTRPKTNKLVSLPWWHPKQGGDPKPAAAPSPESAPGPWWSSSSEDGDSASESDAGGKRSGTELISLELPAPLVVAPLPTAPGAPPPAPMAYAPPPSEPNSPAAVGALAPNLIEPPAVLRPSRRITPVVPISKRELERSAERVADLIAAAEAAQLVDAAQANELIDSAKVAGRVRGIVRPEVEEQSPAPEPEAPRSMEPEELRGRRLERGRRGDSSESERREAVSGRRSFVSERLALPVPATAQHWSGAGRRVDSSFRIFFLAVAILILCLMTFFLIA